MADDHQETEHEALKLIVDAKKNLHDQKVKGKKDQPSNPISGLGRGVLSIGGGVLLGAGCLVVGTVGGLVGSVVKADPSLAVKGPAIGIAGLVAFPIAGLAKGVTQMGQGTKNTFKNDKSEYITEEEEEELFTQAQEYLFAQQEGDDAAGAAAGAAGPGALPKPVDTELYEELEISPDATPSQIKKAYYKLARTYHPDKCKEENAEEKFKKISDAYQILGDEEKRAEYHRYGKEGVAQAGIGLTPDYLFVLMFGNNGFMDYIGHLRIIEMIKLDQNMPDAEKRAILKERQKERIETLVAALKAKLVDWTEGGEEGAETGREKARQEVEKLRKTPFGVDLLQTIGYVYKQQGKRLLVKHEGVIGFRSWWMGLSEGGHMMSEKAKAQSAALDMAMKDAMRQGNDRDTMVSQLGQVWLQSSIDIQETIATVLQRVLDEKDVSKKEKKLRSKGVIQIGRIFYALGDKDKEKELEKEDEQFEKAEEKKEEKVEEESIDEGLD